MHICQLLSRKDKNKDKEARNNKKTNGQPVCYTSTGLSQDTNSGQQHLAVFKLFLKNKLNSTDEIGLIVQQVKFTRFEDKRINYNNY